MPSSVKNATRPAVRKASGAATTTRRPTTQQFNRRPARAARRAAERRRRNRFLAITGAGLIVLLAVLVFHDRLPNFGGQQAKGQTFNCPVATATPIGPQPKLNAPEHPPALPKDAKTQTQNVTIPDATGNPKTFAMQYVIIVQGCGPTTKAGDNVTVQYTGWTQSDGKRFDSSLTRDPNTFQVTSLGGDQPQVIQGWNFGLVGMKPGETRRLIIPSELGYGSAGSPPNIP